MFSDFIKTWKENFGKIRLGTVRYDDEKIEKMAGPTFPQNIFIKDIEYEWWCTSNTPWGEGFASAAHGSMREDGTSPFLYMPFGTERVPHLWDIYKRVPVPDTRESQLL